MGYYCTVPQCTSLAGKTKNVKFHRFPRDITMADKWNVILKRGKPYTKYSKVCSLHFTQNDYNVTNMGQWKTLSKDAVPSQNLPKLNPDGTVMVIRKSRTLKYKECRKDEPIDKVEKWSPMPMNHAPPAPAPMPEPTAEAESSLAYRLQTLHAIANGVSPTHTHSQPSPSPSQPVKPNKQDAFMQTDPVQSEEDENNQPNNSYSEASEERPQAEPIAQTSEQYGSHRPTETQGAQIRTAEYPVQYKEPEKTYEPPKDYTKQSEDYIPQTDEEYNKEAEKYALGPKSLNGYDKEYQKNMDYQKMGQLYAFNQKEDFRSYYPNGYTDSVELLRSQQASLQALQQQHRLPENQMYPDAIKQEVDLSQDDMYERSKEIADRDAMYSGERRLAPRSGELAPLVKQEPDGCENVMQPQGSPYGYSNGINSVQGYYDQLSRPGPEMLIAKQNALAAQTQLWQNTMKRPFFYSESPLYNGPPLLHRYESLPWLRCPGSLLNSISSDIPRILQ